MIQNEEKNILVSITLIKLTSHLLNLWLNDFISQTGMTLNERFGILKEQRTALSQNKGSRFVTVG